MQKQKNVLALLSIILFFALIMLFTGDKFGSSGISGAFLYPEVGLKLVAVVVLMLLVVERGIKKK